MSDNLVQSIRKNSLALGGFALLAALLLASVYGVTKERIAEQQLQAERRALNDILPAAFHDNDLLADPITLNPTPGAPTPFDLLDALQLTTPRQGYIARQGGEFVGAILPAEAHDGYSGDILLLVGILADGTVSGVRVLAHRETPGLGDKIDLGISDWILGFDGKSLDNPPAPRWQVIKDGGDFDQLVGATVTPRAVVNAVRRALNFYEINKGRLANPNANY